MKSANFTYAAVTSSGTSNRILRGKVTLKDDGTISVNLTDARMCSANMRYMAKKHGTKIAEDGFIDPKITNFVEENHNDILIDILKKETESLRIQYIEKTKEYANKKFEWAQKLWLSNITERMDHFNIKWEMQTKRSYAKNGPEFVEVPTVIGDFNTELNLMWKNVDEAKKIFATTLKTFIAKNVESAERHYNDSIQKLAKRIESKGLIIEKIKAVTSHVDVNIETILTDGDLTVKAWTIIAEGPIQRPHYRYLIK